MKSQSPKLSSPSHSEWGVLNSLKQRQYEQALRIQRLLDQQKKQTFRSELDKQLQSKESSQMFEKKEDKSYYNFIVNKTKEQENRQKQQKQQKYLTRRSVDWQNRKREIEERESMNNSRFRNDQNLGQQRYMIGFRDEATLKAQQQLQKQKVINQLSDQVRYKQNTKREQRIKQIQDFHRDIEYQNKLSQSQSTNKNRHKQNDKVYQYYSNLYQQKQQQKDQLEYSLVQKPILNRMQSEDLMHHRKVNEEQIKKQRFRDALDHQVDEHRTQLRIEKQPKPQDISYSFFGTMFDPSTKGYGSYDKKAYNEYLQKQMTEQRQNKKKFEFMDEREYLYNLNQINKALNGTYLNQSYQDCSIANVGEKLKIDKKKFQSNSKIGSNHEKHDFNFENPQVNFSREKQPYAQDKQQIKQNLNELLKKHTSSQKQSLVNQQQLNSKIGNPN